MIDNEITGQVADEIEAILQANFSGYTIYGKDDTLASALKNIYRMPGIVITVNPLQPSTAFLEFQSLVGGRERRRKYPVR